MSSDASDFEAVIAAEWALLDPAVRANPDAVSALLDEEFVEFGASGTVWDRVEIIAALAKSPGVGATSPSEFRCLRIGTDSVLLTYHVVDGGRTRLRSSVWRRSDGAWRILFHQGTPVLAA